MTILHGHFDGKQIVLDEPLSQAIPVNAKVRVIVEEADPPQEPASRQPSSLLRIAQMATDADLPTDFSIQHAHYTKGFPRK